MKPGFIIAVIVTLGQLPPAAAAQGVAYQWVDGDGVTHFSDKPPASGQAADGGVESIDLPAESTATSPAGDYYSIANQWQRMHQERVENERLALQQEQISLEQARAEQSQQPAAAAPEATPPVVFFGGAPGYPRAPRGGRVYRGMQPIYFHGRSQRSYPSQRDHDTSRRYTPVHFQLGGSAGGSADSGPGPANQCCSSLDR